jgi:hypothetical protein
MAKENMTQNLNAIFESVLNQHGHPFQYAVIRRANELYDEKHSPWVFEASEFPVEVRDQQTRIDFVLSQRGELPLEPFRFLVAECKRANPSLSNWFFVRSPYVGRRGIKRKALVEQILRIGKKSRASLGRFDISEDVFHVGYEVKGSAKGYASGSGRGAIEEAATQVIRGVNGLIECLSKNWNYLPENVPVTFIPTIFTTARIWVSDVDLARTNIVQGQVKLDSSDVREKPWLWLQYHVSQGLKHTLDTRLEDDPLHRTDLGRLLEMEYARTIAIVGSNGIDDFLMQWSF